jgi:nucleoside-diphosphate-sugar epimerase
MTVEVASFPRVVLTGASGWIGSAMLAHLEARLGNVWRDHVTLFGSRAGMLASPVGDVPVRALTDLSGTDVRDAIVIHLAYLTKEKADERGEEAFASVNRAIDTCVLDAVAHGVPRSIFVASSGAAALAASGTDNHPYGLAKLEQEQRFLDAAKALGVATLVGRVFNLSGPYINKIDSYAIGAFATQALLDGQIKVDAQLPVFRSFLHVDDLCALVIEAGLAQQNHVRPIDLCGAEILEMGDIASRVADAVGGGIGIVRRTVDVSRPSIYLGAATDTKLLAMSLALNLRPFDQQVKDTITFVAKLHRVASMRAEARTVAPGDPSGAAGAVAGSGQAAPLPCSDDEIVPSSFIDGNQVSGIGR